MEGNSEAYFEFEPDCSDSDCEDIGAIVQKRPLPIRDELVSKRLDEAVNECDSLQDSLAPAIEVNRSGPFAKPLAQMKETLKNTLRSLKFNRVRGILRGYLNSL